MNLKFMHLTAELAKQHMLEAKSKDLSKALAIIEDKATEGFGSVMMDVSHLEQPAREKLAALLTVRGFSVSDDKFDPMAKTVIMKVGWV